MPLTTVAVMSSGHGTAGYFGQEVLSVWGLTHINPIPHCELAMAPIALLHEAEQFRGSRVVFFLDNSVALQNLVQGASNNVHLDRSPNCKLSAGSSIYPASLTGPACWRTKPLRKAIIYLCVQFQCHSSSGKVHCLVLSDAWTECTALAAGTTVGMHSEIIETCCSKGRLGAAARRSNK
eukprot:3262992-Amphidinium_carterae.2